MKSIISEILFGIRSIEENSALYEEANFNDRTNALDFLDFHIIDRFEELPPNALLTDDLRILRQRADQLKNELEEIDINLFARLREKIRTGTYNGSSFREMIHEYLGSYFTNIGLPDKIGYDNLDAFVNGLLLKNALPEETLKREPGMVFYQQTPSRVILEMVKLAKLKPTDVFFDLGSGLGLVTILVALLSSASVTGIEYEPSYCSYAQTCVLCLNLSMVKFINIDARNADYSKGTVFFMYTPFEGSILQDVLEVLQKEAQNRTIRVFTYGPCSAHVALQDWLICSEIKVDDPYKLYEFKSSPV